MLIVQASPRAGGVSDAVAEIFAREAALAGAEIRCLPLRRYDIRPCLGCRACSAPPHGCVLAGQDQAEEVFRLLREAPAIFVAAPIYFYALPAHFKALIDRSQRFWSALEHGGLHPKGAVPVTAALTAGRKRGRRLFSGAALTLAYFARAIGATLEKPLLLRGLEEPADLRRRGAVRRDIENLGRRWGSTAVAVDARRL